MSDAPHPFSLRQLQYARAVAETLSFRRAAELCRVSQPALSTQLAQMEEVLGARLFERSQRGVVVTPAGRALLAAVERVLREADDLVELARRSADPLAGTLCIGVIPTVSPHLLPLASPALARRFPRLDVRWREDKTETLVAELRHGRLEAALLALEAELGEVEQAPVAEDPFLLAMPPGHPLASSGEPARLRDLRRERVLLLDEGHCLREQALAFCGRARAEELEFRATSLTTLVQMVSAGAGLTLLPALAAAEGARAGLVLRPFAPPAPHRTIGLVWRRGSPLAGALRELAKAIADAYPVAAGRRCLSSGQPAARPPSMLARLTRGEAMDDTTAPMSDGESHPGGVEVERAKPGPGSIDPRGRVA